MRDVQRQPPLYKEFAARLQRAVGRKQSVQACYDKNSYVFHVTLMDPPARPHGLCLWPGMKLRPDRKPRRSLVDPARRSF